MRHRIGRMALAVLVGLMGLWLLGALLTPRGPDAELARTVREAMHIVRETAREMLAETAAGRLLEGVRGQPAGDLDAVTEALLRVGQLMADLPQVAEIDLNPLIVGPAGEGAWAVDVRIVLAETMTGKDDE